MTFSARNPKNRLRALALKCLVLSFHREDAKALRNLWRRRSREPGPTDCAPDAFKLDRNFDFGYTIRKPLT